MLSSLRVPAHMLDWIQDNASLLAWTAGASLLMLAIAAAVVVRLPADYFSEDRSRTPPRRNASTTLVVLRNIMGVLLIIAGAAMIVLPGPGILVIILGLTLTDLPGKHRAMRWLVSRGPVLRPVNHLRRLFGRDPLIAPGPRKAPA
jgi:hypothetical protein